MPGPGNYEQVTTQIEGKIASSSTPTQMMKEVNDLLTTAGIGGNSNAYENIVANLAADDRTNTAKDYLPSLIVSTFGENSAFAQSMGYDGYDKGEIQRIIDSPTASPAEKLAATAFLQRFDGVAGSVLQAHQDILQRWDADTATLDDVKMWATGTYGNDSSWSNAMSYRPEIENLLFVMSDKANAGDSVALTALTNNRPATFDQITQDLENQRLGYLNLTQQQVQALEFMKDHPDLIGNLDKHTTTQPNWHFVDNKWVNGISPGSIKDVAFRLGTNEAIAKSVNEDIIDAGVSQSVVEHVPDIQVVRTQALANGGVLKLDASGNALEIDYPGGEFTRFTHAEGALKQIQSSDGLYTFTNNNGVWTRGNPAETVSAPVVNNADGSYSLTYSRNGVNFSETHRADGSTVVTDASGQVVQVTHADAANSTISFYRDANNVLTSIQLSNPPEFIDAVAQQATFDATTGVLTYVKDGKSVSILANGTVQTADALVAQGAGTGQPIVAVTPPADAVAKHDAAAAFNNLEAYQKLALRQNALFMDAAGNFKRRPATGAPDRAAWDAQVFAQPENVRNFINQVQDNWTAIDNVPGNAAEGAVNIDAVLSEGLVAPDATAAGKNVEQADFRTNNQTYTLDGKHVSDMAIEVLAARGITPANTPDFANAVKAETMRIMVLNGYRPDGGATAKKDANGVTQKGWNSITWPQTFKVYDPADAESARLLAEIDLKLAQPGHYNLESHSMLPM